VEKEQAKGWGSHGFGYVHGQRAFPVTYLMYDYLLIEAESPGQHGSMLTERTMPVRVPEDSGECLPKACRLNRKSSMQP
jgi:hypothetical protein